MIAGNRTETSLTVGNEQMLAKEGLAEVDLAARPLKSSRSWSTTLRALFSFPMFLGALLVGGVFLTLTLNLNEVASTGTRHTNSFIEGDTWWHIAVGERILST